MKLPICWLKEFADIGDASPEDIAAALLRVGFEVEEIIYAGADIENVVVGKVIDCKPHENSDHLHICMVDVASEILQIVCGAPNVNTGDVVPCALVGARLPGGVNIKAGELRGVTSYGMLCSGAELGIDDTVIEGAEVDGLLQLPKDTPLGTDIRKVLGLDEYVLDVSVTANRPDCQSVVGLAREVAASMGVKFKPPVNKYKTVPYTGEYMPTVAIKSDICSRYTGRLIKDVKIESSPKWMRDRLRLVGVRPINNIVDITNYVLFEIGQPLHSFDVRFIDKGIIVRNAAEGEKITALDGKEYTLSGDMLVIADSSKPVAIAGVMGGEYSGIMPDTSSVFLEAARFERRSVRVTSRRLGLRSDSSARYEKGVDYGSVDEGRERALALIYKLGAGKIVDVKSDAGVPEPEKKVIETTAAQISSVIGIDIDKPSIEKILRSLDIKVEGKGDKLICTVPVYREDIEDYADLSEEVIRYYGYDNLEPTFMKSASCTLGGLSEKDKRSDDVKNILCGMGAFEAMTYSFVNENACDMLRLDAGDARRNVLKLRNPLNEDTAVMRTQLTHEMIATLALNKSRGNDDFRLFELGRIFVPAAQGELPEERTALSIGAVGKDEDFYEMKSMVNAVLGYFGAEARMEYGSQPYLHPGISADIFVGEERIGSFGEVHPTVCENYGLTGKAYIAELDLEKLLAMPSGDVRYSPISRFPCVNRDLAVVVDDGCGVGDIMASIRQACGSELESVELFDIYKGEQIAAGSKSLAFSLKFRSLDKTLADADVQKLMTAVIDRLKADYGAQLR